MNVWLCRLNFPLSICDPYQVQEVLLDLTAMMESEFQYGDHDPHELAAMAALHTLLAAQHAANVHNDKIP